MKRLLVYGYVSKEWSASLLCVASHATRLLTLDSEKLFVELPNLPQQHPPRTFLLSEYLPGADLLAATRGSVVIAKKNTQKIVIIDFNDGETSCSSSLSRSHNVPGGVSMLCGTHDWICALDINGERLYLFPAEIGSSLVSPFPPMISAPPGRKIVSVAVGARHLMVIDQQGNLLCMGSNAYGQLGLGDEEDQEEEEAAEENEANRVSVLRPVTLPERVVSAGAGAWHTIVATSDGRVYVWGSNSSGQLGLGAEHPGKRRAKRIKSTLPPSVVQVCAGTRHSAALTADGNLYAWGFCGADQVQWTPLLMRDKIPRSDLFGAGGWYTWIGWED